MSTLSPIKSGAASLEQTASCQSGLVFVGKFVAEHTPRQLLSFFLIVLLSLLIPKELWAHSVGIEARVKQDQVQIAVFYDDDTPARSAQVKVFGPEGSLLAEGKTDASGVWSLPKPAEGQYRVWVDAGSGHRAERSMTIRALSSAPTAEPTVEPTEEIVSEGPTRDDFTRLPWGKVLLGLGIIAGLSLLWLGRVKRTAT